MILKEDPEKWLCPESYEKYKEHYAYETEELKRDYSFLTFMEDILSWCKITMIAYGKNRESRETIIDIWVTEDTVE
ncbi:hypothetical protein AGMMS49574_29290 [Bacteroidia bacterium]|nr:hypothetical protein AGMMS49574_29290 [Bacteroidia bacterium]